MWSYERVLLTSVGSFPKLNESSEASIKLFTDRQIQLGYDIVTDGEPRSDMIGYFVDSIPGLGYSNGKPAIVGNITEMPDVYEFSKIKDYQFQRIYLQRKNIEKEIKVAVTGPITLGFTCAMGGLKKYENVRDFKIYQDLAYALNPVLVKLQNLGAIVQIDEPGLSAGFVSYDFIKYIDIAAEGLNPDRTVLHVCGKISKNLHKILLGLENVSVFSHAFAGTIENLDVLERNEMKHSDKKLGLGCARVDVKDLYGVNTIDDIVSTINRVESAVGEDLIACIHPDCGLGTTPLEVAEKILENLPLANSKLKKED